MRDELNLSGTELDCYAVIYCLSQSDNRYIAGVKRLMQLLHKSEPTVISALKGLTEKELVKKEPVVINGSTHYYYKALRPTLNNLSTPTLNDLSTPTLNDLRHNINNNNISKSVSNDTQKVDSLFETFWDKYGYKKSKKPTMSAWRKLTKAQKEAAIKGIDLYKEDCRRNQRQMKHPSTYLNQLTWEDDFTSDGMVEESEEEKLPAGLDRQIWEKCRKWFINRTPRISGYITPDVYLKIKGVAKDSRELADIILYIEASGYNGDIVTEFSRLKITGEYKPSVVWTEDNS
jgi:predicted transcriptional regulator